VLYVKRLLRAVFDRVEDQYDRLFTPSLNPFYQLGTLGWFFYWIVAVSGIYLFIFFDTGVTQAYASIQYITHEQWYAGGVMRSLHRYASDALVIVVILHLAREFALDRMRGRRWFAWFTGVPLLWFIYACGITGYWLVWDMLAQYVAISTAEWLDALPFFGQTIAENFVDSAKLSGRFFTLMVYIHIAVPLFMLFIMWIHIQRHSEARTNPPRGLAAGTLSGLVVLAFVFPAVSHEPANLEAVASVIDPDWFYLAILPLLDVIPGGQLWLIVGLVTMLLLLLPWLPPLRGAPAAVVDLENCNGCSRCYDDCPFSAITMMPRSDGRSFEQEAVVNISNCMSCGICVGSCPTATPFRRSQALSPGIQLPNYPISDMREETLKKSDQLSGESRVIVYACEHSGNARSLEQGSIGVITMPCVGMLPPSFVDFALSRNLADGVFISGCRECDCHFRLGGNWTERRLARQRDPYIRQRVPKERFKLNWSSPSRQEHLKQTLEKFRGGLADLPPMQKRRIEDFRTRLAGEAQRHV
jgi:quinol-cytochrome oxidoreductase complex cytochrome b subunit/coenzyme F420-reducing hydrogenase delta subunit/Pyruvate/2-oxoacid:ferredoxin oxidoreductase delta subunit